MHNTSGICQADNVDAFVAPNATTLRAVRYGIDRWMVDRWMIDGWIDGTIEPYSFRVGVCQNIVDNVATYDSLLRYAYSFLKRKRSL